MTIDTSIAPVSMFAIIAFGVLGAIAAWHQFHRSPLTRTLSRAQ
jgi:hypothetical protein